MRTKQEVKDNIGQIFDLLDAMDKQIGILEAEYQSEAVKALGHREKDFDRMITGLEKGRDCLESFLRYEIDCADEME